MPRRKQITVCYSLSKRSLRRPDVRRGLCARAGRCWIFAPSLAERTGMPFFCCAYPSLCLPADAGAVRLRHACCSDTAPAPRAAAPTQGQCHPAAARKAPEEEQACASYWSSSSSSSTSPSHQRPFHSGRRGRPYGAWLCITTTYNHRPQPSALPGPPSFFFLLLSPLSAVG